MEVLAALGLNSSVLIQFFLFVAIYMVLSRFLFQPYYQAFLRRSERTIGSTEEAEKINAQSESLEQKYANSLKSLNVEVKKIYEAAKTQAHAEQEDILRKARAHAKELLDESLVETKRQIQAAQPQIQAESLSVSKEIVQKLLGKDMAI
jgi:F-type H+-transporting ATPase subunit b